MFGWVDKIQKKIKELNRSVNVYKEETGNQALPTTAYINRAKKFIDKSLCLEARDVLLEACKISENDALVYKYLGICEEKLGNMPLAIEMFKKSAHINPQDKNIWYKLGMLQVNMKLFDEAESSFEEACKVTPVNTDVYTGWGMALLKQKKYSPALEKFSKAIQINRYNFSALLLASIAEIRLGNFNDAEDKLSFLMTANPTEGAAYEYANLCRQKGNFNEAIKYGEMSVSLNPYMLPAYMLLGEVNAAKFDYELSMKWFNEAEEHKLTNSILYVSWGNALVDLYRFEEAKLKYQSALLKDIESIDAQAGMALCCAETKDFDRMHDFVKFVEEKNGTFYAVEEAKGIAQLAYGNVDNAIEIFKSVLTKDPKRVFNYYRLAKCYARIGKTDMVKDSYDKLLKINPLFAAGYLDYAKYLISLEDYKDAQRKLRKAEKLSPNNQEILNLLFYTCYILVKENLCEYNIKEAISIADKVENFEYPEFREDLERLLREIKED